MVMKTKEEARANLDAAIAYIPDRYSSGVMKADWATPAGSDQAEKNFGSSMSKVIADKSRQKGVKATPNTVWQTQASTAGAAVIGERIRGALDKWAGNWGPKYDQVQSTVKALPPSTTDFRANINNRLVKVVETWKRAAGKL